MKILTHHVQEPERYSQFLVRVKLVGVNVETGSESWAININDIFFSSPLYVNESSGNILILVLSNSGTIYKINTVNGNIIWQKNYNSAVTSSPTYIDSIDSVCFGTEDGRIVCLGLDGNDKWINALTEPVRTTGAYYDGNIFYKYKFWKT